jgi:hypothetical protein
MSRFSQVTGPATQLDHIDKTLRGSTQSQIGGNYMHPRRQSRTRSKQALQATYAIAPHSLVERPETLHFCTRARPTLLGPHQLLCRSIPLTWRAWWRRWLGGVSQSLVAARPRRRRSGHRRRRAVLRGLPGSTIRVGTQSSVDWARKQEQPRLK